MKKALLTLAALAMAGSAYAQGTITFFNNGIDNASGSGSYDAPIFLADGTTGIGSGFTVGLYDGATLVPGSLTTFISGAPGFFNPVFDLPIPGRAPGSTPSLTVKVWETSAGSFAAALTRGEQTFTAKPLGGANPTPPPPAFFTPTMTGFTGFAVTVVPEPATIALGAIGIGALLLRRRK